MMMPLDYYEPELAPVPFTHARPTQIKNALDSAHFHFKYILLQVANSLLWRLLLNSATNNINGLPPHGMVCINIALSKKPNCKLQRRKLFVIISQALALLRLQEWHGASDCSAIGGSLVRWAGE